MFILCGFLYVFVGIAIYNSVSWFYCLGILSCQFFQCSTVRIADAICQNLFVIIILTRAEKMCLTVSILLIILWGF